MVKVFVTKSYAPFGQSNQLKQSLASSSLSKAFRFVSHFVRRQAIVAALSSSLHEVKRTFSTCLTVELFPFLGKLLLQTLQLVDDIVVFWSAAPPPD
jgi:hypothetical protein